MELTILTPLAVVAALILLRRMFPVRLLCKVALNTLLGFGALLLLESASPLTGISLGLNWCNALVVGVLGVPGLGLLLLVQWVFT